ncbi:DUF3800 domain-containing protein [Phenylobacterium terrae]|uniref:DUF3800 domain-containing protein n=1 Tax=Phenylobacterium terrae TaxID=2665495 RepID=A0ABW4N6C6_9CAUL
MLIAFIDDSIGRQSDQRLFLAGYLTRDDIWAAFTLEWQAQLARAPAIEQFHMVEAQGLRGPFQGWSVEARDAKVMSLARLIARYPLFSFQFSVSMTEHKQYFGDSVPYGLSKPYNVCAQALASGLARCLYQQGFREPIEFVFDTQEGADIDLTVLWPWIRRSSPGPWRELLGTPRFADDRHALPLQAADMLVWHIRRMHDGTDQPGALPAANLVHGEVHLEAHIDRARLGHLGRKIRKVPGVSMLRRKADWLQTRKSIDQHQRLGLGPPRMGPRAAYAMAWLRYWLPRWFRRRTQRRR